MGIPFKTPANDEVSSVVSANAVTNGLYDELTDPRYAVVNIYDVRKITPVILLLLSYLERVYYMYVVINLAIK